MPRLRLATWICVWEQLPVLIPLPRPERETVLLDAPTGDIVAMPAAEPERTSAAPVHAKDKRTFMALKTNLLYDAVTAANYSLEFPINEHFSILYNQVTPWWLSKNNKYCLQVLTFGGEFRWWFKPKTRPASDKLVKRDALMGHFLGVYGFGGKFDVQWEDKFGLYQGEVMSFGLTYGYSMPIGKRVNLEFSISAGYASIPYRHYIPTDDWQILIRDRNNAGRMHWFGPTKAEISLVIPLLATYKVKGGGR